MGTGGKCWQVSKTVGVGVILTLALQFASGVWWASKADSRLSYLEAKQSQLECVPVDIAEIKRDLQWIRAALEDSKHTP